MKETPTTKRRGRALFRELESRREWPYIDKWHNQTLKLDHTLTEWGRPLNQDAKPGTFESKAGLIKTKFLKVCKGQGAAVHQLCVILAELQRPGDKALKQAVAAVVEERLEVYNRVCGELLAAIKEAAE